MRSARLGVIVSWQAIALAVCTGFGLWGFGMPYNEELNSTLQIMAFSVSGLFGAVWFFLSVAAFPRCVSELCYAHGYTREKGIIVLGWLGVLSAILAVAALGAGIFILNR